jgi:hypothetical protein
VNQRGSGKRALDKTNAPAPLHSVLAPQGQEAINYYSKRRIAKDTRKSREVLKKKDIKMFESSRGEKPKLQNS